MRRTTVLAAVLLATTAAVVRDAQAVAAPVVAPVVAVSPPEVAVSPVEPAGTWPLRPEPAVVKGFDPPAELWQAGHRGVDLAGHIGQPVLAALAGRVSFAGRIAGVGVVVVDHGGLRTTYQPVTPVVRRGQRVEAGGVLGHLAWFGTHCLPSPCLHWGLLDGDRYLDPLTLVGGPVPVRLLPLSSPLPAPVSGLAPALSGPRMSLVVGRPEPVRGDVGVDLGGRQ